MIKLRGISISKKRRQKELEFVKSFQMLMILRVGGTDCNLTQPYFCKDIEQKYDRNNKYMNVMY